MLIIRKIAVSLLFISIFAITGSTYMLTVSLNTAYWFWGIYSGCLSVFVCSLIVVFLKYESSELLQLKARARKVEEDEASIKHLKKEYEADIRSIKRKDKQIKQKLMQYRQYAEFPDEQLTELNKADFFSDEIAQLLHDQAEIIFDKIINKKYIEKDDFKHDLLL